MFEVNRDESTIEMKEQIKNRDKTLDKYLTFQGEHQLNKESRK